jgi:hypothetical protein
MTRTTAAKRTSTPVDETVDLGFALLIAEGAAGGYEPVAVVSTVREAREFAGRDFEERLREADKGAEPMYPARYAIWTRGGQGKYRTITTFEAN